MEERPRSVRRCQHAYRTIISDKFLTVRVALAAGCRTLASSPGCLAGEPSSTKGGSDAASGDMGAGDYSNHSAVTASVNISVRRTAGDAILLFLCDFIDRPSFDTRRFFELTAAKSTAERPRTIGPTQRLDLRNQSKPFETNQKY